MKKLVSVFALLAAAFGQAPPMYNGVTTTTSPIGTLNPGFSPSTPYNTTVYSPLNPNMNPDTVLTDANWNCGKAGLNATALSEGNLTASESSGDKMASLPLPDGSEYIAVHLNGTNCLLHIAFDPVTGAAKNITNGGENALVNVPGTFGFSTVVPDAFYTFDNRFLHQWIIVNDAVVSEVKNTQFPFDFSTCPGAVTGAKANSGSILNVSAGDRVFAVNMSWTGGQGTSHNVFAYQPGVGCASLDVQTGTVTNFSGTVVGTETACLDPSAALGQGIHDTELSNDGRIASIAGGAWQQWGAGNFCYWEVGTVNTQSMSAVKPPFHASGHGTTGSRTALFLDPPFPNIRNVYPLTAANLANFQVLAKIPNINLMTEMHGSQAHQFYSDLTPWIIVSSGTNAIVNQPAAYVNEVFGIQTLLPNMPILRFGTTWNSTGGGVGGCRAGISYISQDGRHVFFLSDGLLSFGLDTNGKPLCLLFSKTL